MRNLIAIVILFCLAVGCRSKKEFTQTEKTVKIDTVYIENKVIDTIIITEKKEVTKPIYYETIIDCDSLNQSGKIGTGDSYTQYKKENGKVFLYSLIEGITSYDKSFYRSKFIKDSTALRKELLKDSDQVEVIKVYVYPWWIYAIIIAGILSIAFNIYQRFKPV